MEDNNMNLTKTSEEGLEYNTQRNQIVLSQYGRNIHKLVEYALTITDKTERQLAAEQIAKAMEILNPKVRYMDDFKKVIWNHLAIMSDFKLDIEYPFEIIKKEEIKSKPEKITVEKIRIKKRQYGRIIDKMIVIAKEMEDKEMKKDFIEEILLQMKRVYVVWNKDVVSDKVIFDDFKNISNDELDIPEGFSLPQSYEFRNKQQQNKPSKRRFKKKK